MNEYTSELRLEYRDASSTVIRNSIFLGIIILKCNKIVIKQKMMSHIKKSKQTYGPFGQDYRVAALSRLT